MWVRRVFFHNKVVSRSTGEGLELGGWAASVL